MPLSEVISITVSFKREFFSFCVNVTQCADENSHCFRLKELGHAVSLFNCSLMLPSEKQIRQRDMLLLTSSIHLRLSIHGRCGLEIFWGMKFIPLISIVHIPFGRQ